MNIATIEQRIVDHTPAVYEPRAQTRQAAVAVILRERPEASTEILFIKRAEHDGDPWSGHMAFPGGHLDPEDDSLRSAARRETLEEIGLDLQPARYLGSIDYQKAMPRGNRDMVVTPHVWVLTEDTPALRPNYEVADIVWSSVPDLLSNQFYSVEPWQVSGSQMTFPGYLLPTGHFVWGLTYKMLMSLFTIIDPDWRRPGERG